MANPAFALPIAGRVAIGDVEVAEDEDVHARAQVAGDGFRRCRDDRLLTVEAGVEQHRHAGQFPEGLDDPVVAGVGRALDGLDAAGAVGVDRGRDQVRLLGTDARRDRHERIGLVDEEILGGVFDEYGRSKRTEALALLDLGVDHVTH